jgi:hypothetical protein
MDLRKLAHENILRDQTKEAVDSPFFVRFLKCKTCNWVSLAMNKYDNTSYSISRCFICGEVPTPRDMRKALAIK